MNINQLNEDMQRVQMEYAANPTPENLAKMQNEMMRLQQEMMTAAMQGAPAMAGGFDAGAGHPFAGTDLMDELTGAQAEASAFGQMLSQTMGEIAEEEEEETQAIVDFIAAHPPAPDKARYLPIGAFLLSTNGEPGETFALTTAKEEWVAAIADGWEIEDAQAGRAMLASLLQGRHTEVFDEDYRNFKSGQPHELDEDGVEAFNDMLETLSEALPVLLPYAQSCKTILAWDLERAGYLARIFAHLGWISETEAFDWLEKTAAVVKKTFGGWEEYAVSIMTGRALHFESADPVVEAACELFDGGNPFLRNHPFADL